MGMPGDPFWQRHNVASRGGQMGIANRGMINFRRCAAGDVLDSARHETFRTFSALGWFVEFILQTAASFRDYGLLAWRRDAIASGGDGPSGLVALHPA